MIIGDLVRGFWNTTLTVLHHLNPFDNVARHPLQGEPMDDDESFTIGGPASRTRSLAPTPSAPSPVNRRSYQPHPNQDKVSATMAASSVRSPLAQARRPLASATSPSRLTSPYVKVSSTSPTGTGQSSASTSRKPATPHPGKSQKTPVATPAAKAVKSVTSPARLTKQRTVSPIRSVKKTTSPSRKPTSAISGRTRSRSRARSAIREPALGTITEEKLKGKKTPTEKKKSSVKQATKGLKRKSDEGVVRRPRRVKHEEESVMTPEELMVKGHRKTSASTGARAVKKAKI